MGDKEHGKEMRDLISLKDQTKYDIIEADDDSLGWLPDGWIREVFRAEDGSFNWYYTSPISDFTFTSQAEVLEYLFSGMDERIQESKKSATERTLQSTHQWLPQGQGWVMEIRAGGKNMDTMYKYYVQERCGVRLRSKEDVLLYLKESTISSCDTNGQCDTSSDDNILAKVELNPSGLPNGWVKELVFRKTKERTIRRDPYYADPIKGYTFRTLKSALSYVESGKVSKRAFIQKTSVHDMYSFDKCTDLHEYLRKRLTINKKTYHKGTKTHIPRKKLQMYYDGDADSSEDGETSPGSDSSFETEQDFNTVVSGKEQLPQRLSTIKLEATKISSVINKDLGYRNN